VLVWVVDPRRRTVASYPADADVQVLTADDELVAADLLPGIRCSVAALFG
jgi:Uma2 family endonuclease